jgi:hypothetical protein
MLHARPTGPNMPSDRKLRSGDSSFLALSSEGDVSDRVSSVLPALEGKSTSERADIKAAAIVATNPVGEYQNDTYGLHIEIQSVSKIDGGVQVFARAWKDGKQLGFGRDGSVEIERFRIFNPPILVQDPKGSIVGVGTDKYENRVETTYREDPLEAIRQDLAHTIHVVGKEGTAIVQGKVGNTTSTFYPDSDPETNSVDGRAGRQGASQSWASIRGTGNYASDNVTNSLAIFIDSTASTNEWENISRMFTLFNTADIGTDTISSATLSIYPQSNGFSTFGSHTLQVGVSTSSTATTTAIAAGDYAGTNSTIDLATRVNVASITTGAYADFRFNATGLAQINKSGISKFSLRIGMDIDNAPSWENNKEGGVNVYQAEQGGAGTTNDPKLVVEHSVYGGGDYFMSSFDGELRATSTATSTSEYGALVENGDFRKYEYVNDEWWRVTDEFGTIYSFGQASTTRQHKSGEEASTYRWMLEEVRDLNDNFISYEYYKDNGQIYPSNITYSGHRSTEGPFEIEFVRSYNPDIATSSHTGFPVKTDYKISEINVKVSGTLVKHYALTYTNGFHTINKLLASITESGRDDQGATTTLPAYTFDYSNGVTPAWTLDSDFGTSSLKFFVKSGSASGDGIWRDEGTRTIDVNGDGYEDQVQGRATESAAILINDAEEGWIDGVANGWSLPYSFVNSNYTDTGVRILDANGDGLADLVYSNTEGGGHATGTRLGTGTGWTSTTTYRIDPLFTQGVQFGDVNGDGLTDLVQTYAQGGGVYINQGNDTGWVDDSNYTVPNVFHDIGRQVG